MIFFFFFLFIRYDLNQLAAVFECHNNVTSLANFHDIHSQSFYKITEYSRK